MQFFRGKVEIIKGACNKMKKIEEIEEINRKLSPKFKKGSEKILEFLKENRGNAYTKRYLFKKFGLSLYLDIKDYLIEVSSIRNLETGEFYFYYNETWDNMRIKK